MKALITGSKGFVGQHLKKYLEDEGWEVFGFNLRDGQDLNNYEHIRQAVDLVRPDVIFHLAAQAYVPESFTSPRRTFELNTLGSLNLLEAVKQLGVKSKIMLAGTSEEYGDSAYGDGFITEETLPNPLSPYAISKLAMDKLGGLYAKSYGMEVIVTRAFNHTGPGRGEMYAESSFAKQIAEIEKSKRQFLEHGNLVSVRNYTDVRDMVRAYGLVVDLPSGVYNICSDNNVTMQEVLDTLISKSSVEIETKINTNLFRPSDFSFKTPKCEKFKKLTNWSSNISLDTTLEDMLDYWRTRV